MDDWWNSNASTFWTKICNGENLFMDALKAMEEGHASFYSFGFTNPLINQPLISHLHPIDQKESNNQQRQRLQFKLQDLKSEKAQLERQLEQKNLEQSSIRGQRGKNTLSAQKWRLNQKIEQIDLKMSKMVTKLENLRLKEENEGLVEKVSQLERKMEEIVAKDQGQMVQLHLAPAEIQDPGSDWNVPAQETDLSIIDWQPPTFSGEKRENLLLIKNQLIKKLNPLRLAYWKKFNELHMVQAYDIRFEKLNLEKELMKQNFENIKLKMSENNLELKILDFEHLVGCLKKENEELKIQISNERNEGQGAPEMMTWEGQIMQIDFPGMDVQSMMQNQYDFDPFAENSCMM